MYSAEWCGVCKVAKRYFELKKVSYTDRDIDKDKSARREYDKLGATGVSVLFVGKKRMNGFRPSTFDQLYSAQ